MARIRTIKPEFWGDEKLAPMDPTTRLVFLGLISMADDAGRLLDSVKLIDGVLFAYTDDSSREALANLSRAGRIRRGKTASGQRIIQIANWRHQKVDHPNLKAALPPITEELTEDSREIREENRGASRGARDSISTSDQLPATSTNVSPHKAAAAPPVLFGPEPVGASPKTPRRPRRQHQLAPVAPAVPAPYLDHLYRVWCDVGGVIAIPRFRAAISPAIKAGFTVGQVERAMRKWTTERREAEKAINLEWFVAELGSVVKAKDEGGSLFVMAPGDLGLTVEEATARRRAHLETLRERDEAAMRDLLAEAEARGA